MSCGERCPHTLLRKHANTHNTHSVHCASMAGRVHIHYPEKIHTKICAFSSNVDVSGPESWRPIRHWFKMSEVGVQVPPPSIHSARAYITYF